MKKIIATLGCIFFVLTGFTQHHVIYDGNGNDGGIVPIDAVLYETGDTVTVLWDEPITKTGFTFACWNTMADGSGTNYSPDAESSGPTLILEDSDVILFAQWGNCAGGGLVNYALHFNEGIFMSADDIFESVTIDTMPAFSDVITIEGWINPSTFDETEAHNEPVILKFYNDDVYIGLKAIDGNHVLSWNGWAAYGTTNILANEWTHFAIVVASGTIEAMYINGAPETFTIEGEITNPTSSLWVIGNMTWSASPYRWHGLIDELRVWSAIRSDEEIGVFYDKKLTGNEANLFAYWDFDKNSTSQLLCDHNLNEDNHIGVLRNMEADDWVAGVPLVPLSIAEEKLQVEFSIFPNPSNGYVWINTNSSTFKNMEYTLTNISSVVLKKEIITKENTFVNLSELDARIYFLTVTNGSVKQTKKISIQ